MLSAQLAAAKDELDKARDARNKAKPVATRRKEPESSRFEFSGGKVAATKLRQEELQAELVSVQETLDQESAVLVRQSAKLADIERELANLSAVAAPPLFPSGPGADIQLPQGDLVG